MHYDVAISGAGPAGSIAALLLAQKGVRVALLDRATFPRDKPCAEYLSPQLNTVFRQCGLSDKIFSAAPTKLQGFKIFAQDGRGFKARFAGCTAVEEYTYGLAIPRTSLDTILVEAAAAAGAELHEKTRVTGLSYTTAGARLHAQYLGRECAVEASFIVAADGLRSPIARALGVTKRRPPYRIALVTHMEGIEDLGLYGEMHTSRREGYCGLADLGRGQTTVAMVVDEKEGSHIKGDPTGYMRDALTTYPQLASRVAKARFCKPVLTTSNLSWSVARYTAPRVALAGDATGYYDPFTGEGIYRAVAGGELATQHIFSALQTGTEDVSEYDRELRCLYRGKGLIERIINLVVHHPILFYRVVNTLRQHQDMADTLVGVTGDFLPPHEVLRAGYLARLVW